MTKHLKPESAAFLISLAATGVLLTVVGALFSEGTHVFWTNFFTALGAAIMGAAFSLLIARIFEPSPINEIFRVMSTMKNSPLIVDDARVRPRRQKYHGYMLSHALGKNQWKYRVFDFTKDIRPGYLHARVDVWVPTETKKNPKPHGHARNTPDAASHTEEQPRIGHQVYLYDGYLCDPYHLLLVGQLDKETGQEPDVIQVFPFALQEQGPILAGLAFLETSDKKHIVTPTILSKVPESSETSFGPVESPEEQAHLLALWQRHFLRDFQINVPFETTGFSADEAAALKEKVRKQKHSEE